MTRGKQGPGSASSQDGDSDYSSYDGEEEREGEREGVMADTAFSDTSSSVSGALPRLLII